MKLNKRLRNVFLPAVKNCPNNWILAFLKWYIIDHVRLNSTEMYFLLTNAENTMAGEVEQLKELKEHRKNKEYWTDKIRKGQTKYF